MSFLAFSPSHPHEVAEVGVGWLFCPFPQKKNPKFSRGSVALSVGLRPPGKESSSQRGSALPMDLNLFFLPLLFISSPECF